MKKQASNKRIGGIAKKKKKRAKCNEGKQLITFWLKTVVISMFKELSDNYNNIKNDIETRENNDL